MGRLTIDGTQLVKAIAQLTHADSNPADWPWIVLFDGDLNEASAQVRLPSRRKSPVGLHTMDADVTRHGADGDASTGLVIANPLIFADLAESFSWQGEMPRLDDHERWNRDPMRTVVSSIREHLRERVQIEDKTFDVVYQ